MLEFVQWLLAAACSIIAGWILVLNWTVFWRSKIKGVVAPSWIPLLGGVLGSIALLVAPLPAARHLAWAPLLLDWGSLPGIGYAVLFHLLRNKNG